MGKSMRFLVVEDDFVSRKILQTFLAEIDECDIAKDGKEAIDLFTIALDEQKPYSMICMDIMMPNMSGRDALRGIRYIEDEREIIGSDKVKVIMTTALDDPKNIVGAFRDQCEAYLVKPITKAEVLKTMKELNLID